MKVPGKDRSFVQNSFERDDKAQVKRSQLFIQQRTTFVVKKKFVLFDHLVVCCCIMLYVVVSCCMKFAHDQKCL